MTSLAAFFLAERVCIRVRTMRVGVLPGALVGVFAGALTGVLTGVLGRGLVLLSTVIQNMVWERLLRSFIPVAAMALCFSPILR